MFNELSVRIFGESFEDNFGKNFFQNLLGELTEREKLLYLMGAQMGYSFPDSHESACDRIEADLKDYFASGEVGEVDVFVSFIIGVCKLNNAGCISR